MDVGPFNIQINIKEVVISTISHTERDPQNCHRVLVHDLFKYCRRWGET